ARGRVEVLDARDLPQQSLEWLGDALFDLLGGRPGHSHEDVAHRDDDLRLFFARQLPNGERAEQHGGNQEQRRELRVDEGAGDAPSRTKFVCAHGSSVKREPSMTAGPGEATTRSPVVIPERTSVHALCVSPRVTIRRRSRSPSTTNRRSSAPLRVIADAGTTSVVFWPTRKLTRANIPGLRPTTSAGKSTLTKNAREGTSTVGTISPTRPITGLPSASISTLTVSPIVTLDERDSSTAVSTNTRPCCSSTSSGMPGDARFPGSTRRSMTCPAKGATIRE